MKSRKERIRSQFQVEALEGRVVLSSGVNGLVDGSHHRGDRAVEVQMRRNGQDDPANHNANDNRGGLVQTAGRRRGGADDPANHNANDDRRGLVQMPGRRRGGADDPANHNLLGHRRPHR
jgi:hypothetical protein